MKQHKPKKNFQVVEIDYYFVPSSMKLQNRYIKMYNFFCEHLNRHHDKDKAMQATCVEFGVKYSTVYNARAFVRQLKCMYDKDEQGYKPQND